MVHTPISIMILPVFVAGILMLGILAATGNAQESSNTGKEVKESSNTGNTEESNNHPMCLNEHTEKWEPCVVKNSPQKQESSNTPSSQESSKTEQSSVPVRPTMTLTPIRAHVTTNAHMKATEQQLSENAKTPKP